MGIDPTSGLSGAGQPDLTTNESKAASSGSAPPPQEETTSAEKKPSSKEELIIQTFLDSDLAAAHPEKAQAVEENEADIEKGLGFSLQIKGSTEKASESSQEQTLKSIDAFNTTTSEEDTSSGNSTTASGESSKNKKP